MSTPAADPIETTATLEAAIAHHRDGRLSEADQCYAAILKDAPQNPDALHLKGLVAYQSGHYGAAVQLIEKAIAANPISPEFHNSLGVVWEALGDVAAAIRSYMQAIENRSDYIDAYTNLVRLRPDVAEIRFNLACILHQQGDIPAAIDQYQSAIRLQPGNAEAFNNLGCALREVKRLEEAAEAFGQAILLQPEYAEAHNNLGLTFQEAGQTRQALNCYIRAVHLKSDFSEAHYNLGRMFQLQGEPEKAIQEYRRAIRTAPESSRIYHNWALALQELGRYEEAIEQYAAAVQCDPAYVEAHVNWSLLFLLTGRYQEGWPEYEWRRRRPDWRSANPVYPDLPLWDGTSLAGKRILVQAEQGFGDTIQFVRFLPLLKKHGGKIILEAPLVMHALLQSISVIDELTEPEPKNAQKADVGVHLLSLPGILQTTVPTIPLAVPYLDVPIQKMEKWRARIPVNGFKIGVAWSGNPAHPENPMRSCEPHHYIPLLAMPGVNLYSLQKGPAAERLKELPGRSNIADLGPELQDFADTAAVIMHLDLIISVDTVLVHLAGALGKPVWTLRYHQPYWVWGTTGATSSWYPSMRIFRQSNPGDWKTVFQQVFHQLKQDFLL